MYTATRSLPRRGGFTLIELLIVMAIIGTLVTIVVTAATSTKQARQRSNTDQALSSLHSVLDQQWKAIVDSARQESLPDNLIVIAGGDRDRAKALYVKFRLKQELPTYQEEVNPNLDPLLFAATNLGPKPNFSNLYPKFQQIDTYYAANPALLQEDPARPVLEKSALLLWATMAQPRRGTTFNPADLGAGSIGILASTGDNVFVDAWGNPIGLIRWHNPASPSLSQLPYFGAVQANELDRPPFANQSATPNSTPWLDVLDSLRRLDPATGWVAPPAITTALHPFTNNNYTFYLVSPGPDKRTGTEDDHLSFRLRKEGQGGN